MLAPVWTTAAAAAAATPGAVASVASTGQSRGLWQSNYRPPRGACAFSVVVAIFPLHAALCRARFTCRARRARAARRRKVSLRARSTELQRRWETLESEILETETAKELLEIEQEVAEGSRCHPDTQARFFSPSRAVPAVTFYRDSSAQCPNCQAVWLLLEAKDIDYLVVKEDLRAYGEKSPAFLEKVPTGSLPAVLVGSRVATDSLDAMFLLERLYPDPEKPMFPTFSRLRASALQLLELHRAVVGAWSTYMFCQERPFVNENRVEFQTALEQVEKALEKSDSDWFLPYEHPTIVDIQYVCSMERMVASAMFFKGLDVREEFQSIDRWLRAFEELPWYRATKGDFYSLCMALEPRHGPAVGSNHRMRDELLPANYKLPFKFERDLEALTRTDFTSRIHYVQASWSLLKNCDAVVRYCCRAAGGQQGLWAKGRPDRSRLADPQAAILEPLLLPLELVICTVAEEIFAESGAEQVRLRIRETVKAMPGLEQQLSVCVAYLRDRIGVPRDLPLPSAKVLRSYLAETYRALRGRE